MQFDQYMTQMASWREAMADGKIEPDELLRQARRVEDLLRAFEPKLSDAQHEELTRIFLELTVFYGMQRIAEKVFLLTPRNVEVSAEEKARLIDKGFFNQS